jgi:hypothetical protein
VAGETLATEVRVGQGTAPGGDGYESTREVDLDGVPAWIAIARAAGNR